MNAKAKALGVAISWIKDKFIIQIVYTNVLNKDSTFEYFPISGSKEAVSSVGTIVSSAVVLTILGGVGAVLATLAYKKIIKPAAKNNATEIVVLA